MIAICIGHSRKINGRYDGGAFSDHLGKNERGLNLEVAGIMSRILDRAGEDCTVISDYAGNGYSAAMRDVAGQVKAAHATIAIELHFNAASPTANGHEWLYWTSSGAGKRLAQAFHDAFAPDFPGIKSRGIKSLSPGDRGAEFVRLTHCPSILAEPFFGTNTNDCSQITANRLAESYCKAIMNYLR